MNNIKALNILKNFTIIKDDWEPLCSDRSYDRRNNLKTTCGYENFLNDLIASIAQDYKCGQTSLTSKIEYDLLHTDREPRKTRQITEQNVIKAYNETIKGIVRHIIISSDSGSIEVAVIYPIGNFLPMHKDRYRYYSLCDNKPCKDPSALYIKPQIYCQVSGMKSGFNTSYYQEDYAGKCNVGYFLPLAWPATTGEHFYHFRPSSCAFDPVEIDNSLDASITEQIEKHILRSVIYALGERGVITIATNGAALAAQLKGKPLANNTPFNKSWEDITSDCIKYLRVKQDVINATLNEFCGGK